MSSSRTTWRPHSFETGRAYVALETFGEAAGERFVAGRSYVFESAAYSHYDGCSVFTFVDADTVERKSWWFHDDAPDEQLSRLRAAPSPGRSSGSA